MFFRRGPAFDLVIEDPPPGAGLRRLQRFSGFVQSGAPVPPLQVRLNGVEQTISRHDSGDRSAPRDRRHTAYWVFHLEIPASWGTGDVALDVTAGARRIGRRVFRREAPDDRLDRPLVLMMHIPKTAGTSLRLALEMRPELRLLRLYDDREFLRPSHLAELTPAAFDDLDVVFGHYAYGLHRAIRRPCRYTTILRDPADMLRSSYLFSKYVLGHADAARLGSIEAFGEAIDNPMTRFVSGKATPGPVDAADVDAAKANLERHFAYVGTVEDMATSLRVLGEHLGVPLAHHAINATPATPESGLARDVVMERFGARLAPDFALYAHARDLFAAGPRFTTAEARCSG